MEVEGPNLLSTDTIEESSASHFLEALCVFHGPPIAEDLLNSVDLCLECDDEDVVQQEIHCDSASYPSHTVVGENVSLHITFPNLEDLSTQNPVFKCLICHLEFHQRYKLAKHLRSYHGVVKNFKCEMCSFATTSTRLLTRHTKRMHGEKRKKLIKKLEPMSSLDVSHCPNSVGVKENYTCKVCPFTCKQKRTIIIHKKKHLDENVPLLCEICSKTFLSDAALKRHALIHTTAKSLICTYDNCASVFKFKEQLKSHINRVHINRVDKCRKPRFLCPWGTCGKSFRDSHNLKAHYCKHTGEKPLKCFKCNFRCAQKSSMNFHVNKVH